MGNGSAKGRRVSSRMLLTVIYSDPHNSPQRAQEIEQIMGHGAYRRTHQDGNTELEFGVTREDAEFKAALLGMESPWPVKTRLE